MSGLGRAVGISLMLNDRLTREAARDAQAWDEDASDDHEMIHVPQRTARSAARADVGMWLRMIGNDRPMANAGGHQ